MNKTILIVLAVIILGVGGVFAYQYFNDDEQTENQPAQSSQNDDSNQETNEQNPDEELPPAKRPEGSTDTEPGGNPGSSASVTISNATQDGATVYASAIVDGATSGSCTFIFEKSGQSPVERTVALQLVTSYYACQAGVPRSDFPEGGEWTVKARFTDNAGASVTSNPQTVTLN